MSPEQVRPKATTIDAESVAVTELLGAINSGNADWLYSKFGEVRSNYYEFFPSNTESVTMLGLWFQRAMRLRSGIPDNAPPLADLDNLVRLSVERWTEGDPAYKGALMRTLKDILVFRTKVYGFGNFSEIVESTVSFLHTSPKTTFGVLEVFARSSQDAALHTVRSLDSKFFVESFDILAHQPQRGGLVGRCLAALLSNADPQVWYDLAAPHLKEASQQQNVIIYFLEPSLKQSGNAQPRFSAFLKLCRPLNDPSVEIACLKAATNASLDISEHINGSQAVADGLKALSKSLRYDAFTLVCRATRKLTVPVPREAFDLIRSNAASLFAEGDPQSRADVISCLRHLMLRINTSTKKHPSADADEFVKFLLDWSATSLQPGMPYRCLAMATNLLKLLSDHSVSVCTPRVTSSLLNCVASDYGDIREASVSLLQTAPSLPLVESRFDELVATALNLLSHSRSGDAGARLLEFLNSCRPEAQLGPVVIAAITAATDFAKVNLAAAAKDHSLHGFFIALRILPFYSPAVVPLICKAWDACTGPLLVNAPEGTKDEVMNYCWKAVKESCALIESIAIHAPSMIADVWSLVRRLASMLTDITHWGAFSAVPPAFRAVTRLNATYSSELVWEELHSLQSKQRTRTVTRRSAGLPLLLTSALIVHFEEEIVETLFCIAEMPFEDSSEREDLALPQVHGMNCLNALITDAQLAKRSAPYIERTLQLALNRYTSPSWSLRNCAAMLFAKLHTRLFGVKAPIMAARVFFLRYKSVSSILSLELASKTKDSDLHSVYPALAIVANLQTSVNDDSLDEFWEPVARLLASRSWKVREMAARALKSATPEVMLTEVTSTLIERLSPRDQNQMHGIGMAINRLWENSVLSEYTDERCKGRLARIIQSNICMEVNRELYKAWNRLGGRGRLVNFEDLPDPEYFNPSVATFEAEQARQSCTESTRYGKVKWAPVLRSLPDNQWNLKLSSVVLANLKIPDIQCRCLEALQSMNYSTEMGTLASNLLETTNAQSVRQQALVLSSKASDLDINCWLKTIEEFSLDEAAIECRRSAITSIGVFLNGPLGTMSLDNSQQSVLFYRLFKLLSDDEEVVRHQAALVASRHLQIAPTAAPACEPLILQKVAPRYVTSQLIKNIGSDAESARAAFEDPSDVLFVVEKESLFRDELRNIRLQGAYCSHMVDIPAERKLEGLDWDAPFQASANGQLLEVRARLEALHGN